ncbi:MAG: peptide chain release factor 1 [Desulfovibrio sp.]|nr:peptide chain release factor 1 [Desulfovibrio sp.]
MFAKLEALEKKYLDLEAELAKPDAFSDQARYRKLTKAHADLRDIVELWRKHRSLTEQLNENKQLLKDEDADIRNLAHEEIHILEEALPKIEQELKVALLPTDPLDEKNTILEIRAGTGGEEAALFAADLFRMYARYAELKGWKTEILSESVADGGGYKEVICLVSGNKVYSRLKFEAGTHRVQRVPVTETQGRIHTSAATVAVMPEAEEVDIDIRPEDLRIDIFRASGAGGQHVNKTESAVRITHIPTGTVVTCQDERSQHKNKARAMKVLASRILAAERERQNLEQSADRRAQVGSGDRSERIRTYNFPQGRCTDHRINLTLYSLDRIMEGELDPLLDALATSAQAAALRAEADASGAA